MTTATRTPAGTVRSRPGIPAELPLVGELRLDLSALGIDPNAPDFAERFFRMACDNEPYTIELSANGDLIVMPPAGWESNIGENQTNAPLVVWQNENGGYASSQDVLYQLPSGAMYMPDAAWITQDRFDALRSGEYRSTIPGAPDSVVEVRSRTDGVNAGLTKMQEWMDGGARLGWYIDPYETQAYIFRSGQPIEIVDNPETLSGEDVLPGFVFEVRRLIFTGHDRLSANGD